MYSYKKICSFQQKNNGWNWTTLQGTRVFTFFLRINFNFKDLSEVKNVSH